VADRDRRRRVFDGHLTAHMDAARVDEADRVGGDERRA
jgi:hypothetical protein